MIRKVSRQRALMTSNEPKKSANPKDRGFRSMHILAYGDAIQAVTTKIEKRSENYSRAMLMMSFDAMGTHAEKPELGALPFADVALTHSVFFPGTEEARAVRDVPASALGTLLGAAVLTGESGYVHVYALVQTPPKPAAQISDLLRKMEISPTA